MAFHQTPPSNLQIRHKLAPAPRYQLQSFDNNHLSTPADSSDSILDPTACLSQYGYDSSNIAPQKSPTKHCRSDSLGNRVYTALSDAVRPTTSNSSSPRTSLHSRARSLADTAAPMLARANSIRLGGLLNRTPTQKQQTKQTKAQEPCEEESSDAEDTEDLPEYKTSFTGTPDRVRTPRTPVNPSSSRASRFTWFGQPKADSERTSPVAALELSDPLLDLNVNAALFPTGATDPLNPDSFNSLLTNACTLISRLQVGYREKTGLLKQANAERDAVREESDEASTRVAHLKSQLETMAAKAAEQDRAMRDLAKELALARTRLERQRHDSLHSRGDHSDLEDTPRRRPLKGRTSESIASDSGFESDTAESEGYDQASVPQTLYADSQVFDARPGKTTAPAGTWRVVGDLQRENQRLRTRVQELEGVVEGCLSLVG